MSVVPNLTFELRMPLKALYSLKSRFLVWVHSKSRRSILGILLP